MYRHFPNVPQAYKPLCPWVWNCEVSKRMISKQMSVFSEMGFGGVYVRPRDGMTPEYASEEWYDLIYYTARKAKRMDMTLWINDQNFCPTDINGSHSKYEGLLSFMNGSALRFERQKVLMPDSTKEYLLIQSLNNTTVDITDSYIDSVGKSGDFLLVEKVKYPLNNWRKEHFCVDQLAPGVSERYIDLSMTGYVDQTGRLFGDAVPGIFAIEPHIFYAGDNNLIRWSPGLFEMFESRWGYSPEPHLISLIEPDDMSGQIRHNYYQLLTELLVDRWHKPWYEYCRSHNLVWTGQYWKHGWPLPYLGHDTAAVPTRHPEPGNTILINGGGGRFGQFDNSVDIRELNSVANQLGMVRRLYEASGGSGWERSFEEMKRSGDWLYVLGVNMFNQHQALQSLAGDRKYDYPPSISGHAPYSDEYGHLNDYFARLSLALSTGVQINRTVVLEPVTAAWMTCNPAHPEAVSDKIADEFSNLIELLDSEQIEYDLGLEIIIREHGSVKEDQFVIGKRAYNTVVIPQYMMNLNSETADLIEQYLKNGGIVIALCQPPAYINGTVTDRCRQWSLHYPNQWLSLSGCNDPRLINYLRHDDFVITEQQGGSMLHMRRQLDDGYLLFLVNSSNKERCNARIITRGADMVHLDPFTGLAEQFPCVVTDDILSFDAKLPPAGSLLLFIGDQVVRKKGRRIRRWNGTGTSLEIKGFQTEVQGDNALKLDYCSMIVGKDTSAVIYFEDAKDKKLHSYGFRADRGLSSMQSKAEIFNMDTLIYSSGFTAQYPFFVDSRFRTNDLKLVIEQSHLYDVRLNGLTLEAEEDQWWIDREFGMYRITGGILSGDNLIQITASSMSVLNELQPVYLVGNFDVFALDKGWLLDEPGEKNTGSWREQGLPFYSQNVKYTASFVLDDRTPVRVKLGAWSGTVLTVEVNGKQAGTIFKQPYELRIDPYVRKGENSISIKVTGSLKNLFGPHHNVSQRGPVTPWSFKTAPAGQPSGVDYNLVDYGLFEPFAIEAMR